MYQDKWLVGEIPDWLVLEIGKGLFVRYAIKVQLAGDVFGDIFAEAVGGEHHKSPSGLDDVALRAWGCGWSVKTIQYKEPLKINGGTINLISGRNSPDFSFGINDPHDDINKTGGAVLEIWNKRLADAKRKYDDFRAIVLLRHQAKKEFALFEYVPDIFNIDDFYWDKSDRTTFWGYDKKERKHRFTWQPSGGQFTIKKKVSPHAKKFKIDAEIKTIPYDKVLSLAQYRDNIIKIYND